MTIGFFPKIAAVNPQNRQIPANQSNFSILIKKSENKGLRNEKKQS